MMITLTDLIAFASFNLMASVTTISLLEFLLGNVGSVPLHILRNLIAFSLACFTQDECILKNDKITIGIIVAVIILALPAFLYISDYAKKRLQALNINNKQ